MGPGAMWKGEIWTKTAGGEAAVSGEAAAAPGLRMLDTQRQEGCGVLPWSRQGGADTSVGDISLQR